MGIHWFNIYRKTRTIKDGGRYSCRLIYYAVWQSIITLFLALVPLMLNNAVSWLPVTIVVMTVMNLPLVSAMSG
jgi:hypothetical protein